MDFKAIIMGAAVPIVDGKVLAVGSVAEIDALQAQIEAVSGDAFVDGAFGAGDLKLEIAMLTGPAIVGNTVTRDSACFRPTV